MYDLITFIFIASTIWLLFYSFVFRPEKKRKDKIQNEIKVGSKIVTMKGFMNSRKELIGTVVELTEKTAVIRLADDSKTEITQESIANIISQEGE